MSYRRTRKPGALGPVDDAATQAFAPDRLGVQFLGRPREITCGDVLDTDGTAAFSLSFWVHYSYPYGKWPLSKRDLAAGGPGWEVSLGDGLWFTLSDGVGSISIKTTRINGTNRRDRWAHVCVTYDGTKTAAGTHLYVDGVEDVTVQSDNLVGSTSNAESLRFGGSIAGQDYRSPLDEIGVWEDALTPVQVAEVFNRGLPNNLSALSSSTSLIAWWRLGDGDTFPAFTDRVGGYDGTATGGMLASDIVAHFPGRSSVSCAFDGVDEYVSVGNVPVVQIERTDSHSWSLWIKTTSTVQDDVVLAKMQSTVSPYVGYRLSLAQFQGRSLEYRLRCGPATEDRIYVHQSHSDPGYIDVRDGAWHHVAVTYDGSSDVNGLEIYVDGLLQVVTRSGTTISATILTSNPLHFAADSLPTRNLACSLDEVALYSKALSAGEVAVIYNGGVPLPLTELPGSPNLECWWRMGDFDVFPDLADSAPTGNHATAYNMEAADYAADAP